ncbi:MAG: hypothetical protein RI906_936 [Pseudomonadota bacterium]
MPRRYWLLLVFALAAGSAWAETLTGKVTSVADGDTLTLTVNAGQRFTIRLAGIDAPEKAQPFGTAAAKHLSARVLNRIADVEFHKQDRYGRLVGKVVVDGVDVNLEQVRAGLAWHYKDYQSEQTVADRRLYAAEEQTAKAAGRGLWGEPEPIPPWKWRKAR